MRIEEYIKTLPSEIISGEQVRLAQGPLRDICKLAEIGDGDVFYHLGCGDDLGVRIALERGAARAVGIDTDRGKIEAARRSSPQGSEFRCEDVRRADLSDATAILFWFADEEIVDAMMPRFERLKEGCRIVTVWSPLPGCLPARVDFPYVVNEVPFAPAASVQEQLRTVFGVDCIDFVTAWEHSERYARAIGSPQAQNDRFLTMLQAATVWINARNMGIACGDEMPESIRTYIGILHTFFGIEVEHLLK